jgi:hypothetical protein
MKGHAMNEARPPQNRLQPNAGHAAPLHPAAARPQSVPSHAPSPTPAQDEEISALELEPVEEEQTKDGLEPLSLVESDDNAPSPASKIRAFGVANAGRASHTWKRHTKANGTGSIRVRSFHGKLSEQGMDFMDNQINEWLDNHPEIEIKFVTSAIGTFEGKIREPALVLNVWY